MENNDIFNLAADLVNYTDKHVFLTGKAGTGKTTFLRYIRENTHKNSAVVAPTGVAAINAGGTTLHSMMQLPFGLFIPEGTRPYTGQSREEMHDHHSLTARLRITGTKRKVLEALELLIIDEVSMVRADLLDMVDTVLRFVRKRPQDPFGGVQLLYIGDMFQLPPVVKDEEAEIMRQYYKSVFFFDARVIRESPPVYVELTKVYRQSDERFIEVLNQVRNNALNEDGLALLQSRYLPGFEPATKENYITLTTHNYKADQINATALDALKTPGFEFEAEIREDFPEHALPVEKWLRLKKGAQVMFLKNDTETPRRYFNGKIGVVHAIARDEIKVLCPGEEYPITVAKETWRNIRYTYEANTKSVKEEELGTFTQYPLRLAWAITIHKSQGLTFEKAIIDAGQAFAPGQIYVALSRCTSLDGMVLRSVLHAGMVFADERIALFGSRVRPIAQLRDQTDAAKKEYLQQKLMAVFTPDSFLQQHQHLEALLGRFADMFNSGLAEWLQRVKNPLQKWTEWFAPLKDKLQILLDQGNPETHEPLQKWLLQKVPELQRLYEEEIWPAWRAMPGLASGQTRKSAETFLSVVEKMSDQLRATGQYLERLKNGFSPGAFFAKTEVVKPWAISSPEPGALPKATTYTSSSQVPGSMDEDLPHPELYRQLRRLVNIIVERETIPSYMVANAKTLREMVLALPLTLTDLTHIKGFGPKKADWLGDEFIELIEAYCQEHGLESNMEAVAPEAKAKPKSHAPKPNGSTLQETLQLWDGGNSIAQIAEQRSLAIGTIEGHMAQAVEFGLVPLQKVLPPKTIALIESAWPQETIPPSMIPIKEQLGDAASFGQIRMVLGHKRWLEKKNVDAVGEE